MGDYWLVVVAVAEFDLSVCLGLGTRESSLRGGIALTKEGLRVYNDLNANTIPSMMIIAFSGSLDSSPTLN
jgi:hypothetical protein